jgi:hypothetical protein
VDAGPGLEEYDSQPDSLAAPEIVYLTPDDCRMKTNTMIGGKKVHCVCGIPALDCKQHASAQKKEPDKTRFQSRIYIKAANKGKYPHGVLGSYIRAASTNAEDHGDNRQQITAENNSHRDGAAARVEDEIQVLKRRVDFHPQKQQAFDDLQQATSDRGWILLTTTTSDAFPPFLPWATFFPLEPIRGIQSGCCKDSIASRLLHLRHHVFRPR